jgi:16S rRNA (uracil1498-N3)-methyltransferase
VTAPVFVAPLEGVAAGGTVDLGGAEGRHAARVRRVQPGERLDLVDGLGARAVGVVSAVAGEVVTVAVQDVAVEPVPAPRLVVVQALAKGDRGELAVEVLTEVGVDVVVPWQAARSVVQWRGDRGARALERWRSTAREAGKQARRARFPEVLELATTWDVVQLASVASLAVVLSEDGLAPLGTAPVPAGGDVVLVVGPEGGIAPEEEEALLAAGATAYRLGPSVLRTSTAGVVAAGVVLSRTARW